MVVQPGEEEQPSEARVVAGLPLAVAAQAQLWEVRVVAGLPLAAEAQLSEARVVVEQRPAGAAEAQPSEVRVVVEQRPAVAEGQPWAVPGVGLPSAALQALSLLAAQLGREQLLRPLNKPTGRRPGRPRSRSLRA